jgi:PKD repeat protein
MRKIVAFLFFIPIVFGSAFSQSPLVEKWDYRFGGTTADPLTCIRQTTDGGYILGGSSNSGMSGDKTQNHWGGGGYYDYWIVKIDSLGNKLWDKDFGGINNDYLYSLMQTSDGGYILGGMSLSGIGGDKTGANQGGGDFWILKLNSVGIIEWDKDYGGTDNDILYSLQQTFDGGYILSGYSLSGIGGDKTQPSHGGWDFWVIKIDSIGIIQWDRGFGGDSSDISVSVQQTSDMGYILGGFSKSGISGDKTQPTQGGTDFWIVKTDSLGNILWNKDFGGDAIDCLYSIRQTNDEGYILGGISYSGISGDKTEPNWDMIGNSSDFWIVKTDSMGNKIWDRDFGGVDGEDEFANISQTTDKGYLLSGNSYSNISGNKTENNMAGEQTWILKTDSFGNYQWDKTLHTNTIGDDEIGLAIQANDGCYLMANCTQGGIAGDKTQASRGNTDFWIIKFCEGLQANFVAATNLCPGTCIDFLNLSFNATSYQWNFPGASPDTSTAVNPVNICYSNTGNYDVQLIASNSNGSDTLYFSNYITVFPQPLPQSIIQNGDTLFANAGATSYQWYFNGNIINGATDYFYVAPSSGDYNVVATDVNGCEVEAVINNVVAGLQSTVDRGLLTVFPNPLTESLSIKGYMLIGTAVEISIYNVMGEKVFSDAIPIAIGSKLPTVDCQLFPSGIYYLEIFSDKKTYRAKFLKQ